jgi:hypothetical protein
MNYSEAKEDARRLTKVTGRDVEVVTVHCCDYDKSCACGGEGIYYELRYAFCGHTVQDSDDIECRDADCVHREYEAFCQREEELESVTR